MKNEEIYTRKFLAERGEQYVLTCIESTATEFNAQVDLCDCSGNFNIGTYINLSMDGMICCSKEQAKERLYDLLKEISVVSNELSLLRAMTNKYLDYVQKEL